MDITILFKLSYGLYAIGVREGEEAQGCIVNTVFQVSTDNIVAVSMSKNNHTHDLIEKNGAFAVSIITEQTPPKSIGRLGFFSGASCTKFEGLTYQLWHDLPVLAEHCAGYLYCRVLGSYDAGTHTVYFAQVEDTMQGEDLPVMTYEYYHKVVKGKAPKNAPTYQGS